VERPASVEAVQRAVAAAAASGLRVKPVGAGHSFTGIAVAPDVQLDLGELTGVLDAFEEARAVDAGEDIGSAQYAELAAELPALREAVNRLTEDESPAAIASAVEFVLEGLHLSKRLNKEAAGGRATYRSRG